MMKKMKKMHPQPTFKRAASAVTMASVRAMAAARRAAFSRAVLHFVFKPFSSSFCAHYIMHLTSSALFSFTSTVLPSASSRSAMSCWKSTVQRTSSAFQLQRRRAAQRSKHATAGPASLIGNAGSDPAFMLSASGDVDLLGAAGAPALVLLIIYVSSRISPR
jgi:hypothetical protein